MKLSTRIVEKPWGRIDIPSAFGDMGGRRIGEIWFEDPAGDAAPLMVKFLFTSERLSVQVHPDDAAARDAGFPRGKAECWLVLDAAPDAELGVGLVAPSDRATLAGAARDGSIANMIDWRRAHAHDFVYNPPGTIHAIGAGLMLVEVQQNVDCTYRLYDYGRPRELHLDAGLAVARPVPHTDARDIRVDPARTAMLVSDGPFSLAHLAGGDDTPVPVPDSITLTFVPLSGGCRVDGADAPLGTCWQISDYAAITLEPQARALLCWPQ